MQALKVLVVIMGLMILAGLTLLGAIVASRMAHHPAPAAPVSVPAFRAAPIDLPAGSRIAAIKTDTNRLIVDIVLADGDHQLLVIDLTTGRRLGTIPLHLPH
ncbi:MAG: DUF6476 family protein [Stellaceae bacterium]